MDPNEESTAIVLLNGYDMPIKFPSKSVFTPLHYCCLQSSSAKKEDSNNERSTTKSHNNGSETSELLLCHCGPVVNHRRREMNSCTNPSKMQETSQTKWTKRMQKTEEGRSCSVVTSAEVKHSLHVCVTVKEPTYVHSGGLHEGRLKVSNKNL